MFALRIGGIAKAKPIDAGKASLFVKTILDSRVKADYICIMNITMMKSKIHRAVVTQSDLNYEGSITIDADLIAKAGLRVYEQVDVLNINNGARFTTYVIEGQAGSGIIGVNGAAARLVQKDDLVIICAYASMSEQEANNFSPVILLMDENNHVKSVVSS